MFTRKERDLKCWNIERTMQMPQELALFLEQTWHLSLETWVCVHDEKYQEEYYVTPPNDWISKQINSGLSLMASKDNYSLYKVLTQWFVENISKLFYFQPNHSKLMFMIYTMENIHSISQIIRDATNCIGT